MAHQAEDIRRPGVLIDSGLLLLLLLDLLNRIVKSFAKVVTTPQILTEVSNLASGLTGDLKERFTSTLKAYNDRAIEEYRRAGLISNEAEFYRLGFSDAASLILGDAFQLLTDDFPLAQIASSRGYPVINFNHLRST